LPTEFVPTHLLTHQVERYEEFNRIGDDDPLRRGPRLGGVFLFDNFFAGLHTGRGNSYLTRAAIVSMRLRSCSSCAMVCFAWSLVKPLNSLASAVMRCCKASASRVASPLLKK